ncbi:hypothetical protein Amsp01_088540 [Amycolatopsis sp. NBRC 101858]|nr:hypothetical protein Amsp01_088540 [Amycolatopsis sp. NBRC 101858]
MSTRTRQIGRIRGTQNQVRAAVRQRPDRRQLEREQDEHKGDQHARRDSEPTQRDDGDEAGHDTDPSEHEGAHKRSGSVPRSGSSRESFRPADEVGPLRRSLH